MKKYKVLAPIVLIALMVFSWYSMISETVKTNSEYDTYLTAARANAADGITKYAIANYTAALALQSSPELYAEVAEYYRNNGTKRDYRKWCESFLTAYPEEPKPYECLTQSYINDESYEYAFDTIYAAEARGVESEELQKLRENIRYHYTLDYDVYEDVGVFSNDLCAVKTEGKWGMVNRFGNARIGCRYAEIGVYSTDACTSVVTDQGEAFFVDGTGEKISVPHEKYASFGLRADGVCAAKQTDGQYVYVDADFNRLNGPYADASAYNGGVAAVKAGDRWSLIDRNGSPLTKDTYVDVKLDEKKIAFRNDRCFAASSAGSYILLDGEGKRVGNDTYEDAAVFGGDEYTAVKVNGKWKFIDKDGKAAFDAVFTDARSFVNGLAAVEIDGKWGFIDKTGKTVIEPVFAGAKDFTAKGSCFVFDGSGWRLLKMYSLNREG